MPSIAPVSLSVPCGWNPIMLPPPARWSPAPCSPGRARFSLDEDRIPRLEDLDVGERVAGLSSDDAAGEREPVTVEPAALPTQLPSSMMNASGSRRCRSPTRCGGRAPIPCPIR